MIYQIARGFGLLDNGGDDEAKQASPLPTSTFTIEISELIARDVKGKAVTGATISDGLETLPYFYEIWKCTTLLAPFRTCSGLKKYEYETLGTV